MEELSSLISSQVAGLLDLAGASKVVDVGGGSGTLLVALLQANPAIQGTIVERPEVIPIARALVLERGLETRCSVVEGDFFQGVPPADVWTAQARRTRCVPQIVGRSRQSRRIYYIKPVHLTLARRLNC